MAAHFRLAPARQPARLAAAVPQPGWGRILAEVWEEIDRDHIPIMAAGVAFYGLLSIFPGMSAVISIYGLVADPAVIAGQVAALAEVLPQDALKLLSDQLHSLIAAPPAKLGIGLIVSLLLALWSATSGTGTLMRALTVAYEAKDNRGIIAFYLRASALTIAIGIFGLVSLFLIAVVPAVIDWLPIPETLRTSVALIRWPILAGLVFVALALVYRFAPARHTPRWHWFSPGTVAAALLWLIGSAGFSFYVARFGSYDKTYGALGAVVVLLMWLYVSAYIVLAGAELNSAIEKPGAEVANAAGNGLLTRLVSLSAWISMGGIKMRLTSLTFIGALGIGALGLATTAAPASAAPFVPGLNAGHSSSIVQVWGGCGRGFHPVPAHWSRWRGGWVPPHCAPNYRRYGPYAGWRHSGWRQYGYGYGHRYW